MAKTVKVFEVLFDGPTNGPDGPAGDGTFTKRFRGSQRATAVAFAAASTYLGKPTTATEIEVPRRLAERWGLA